MPLLMPTEKIIREAIRATKHEIANMAERWGPFQTPYREQKRAEARLLTLQSKLLKDISYDGFSISDSIGVNQRTGSNTPRQQDRRARRQAPDRSKYYGSLVGW